MLITAYNLGVGGNILDVSDDGQGSAHERNEIRRVGNVPMGTALPDNLSGRYLYLFC